MYFDTHAHYNSGAFNADRYDVLDAMPGKGISYVVNPGCDEDSSRAAIALAERYPFLYAAVGWQPEEWETWTGKSLDIIRELAKHPRVVAIGEIGLDYYWDKDHKELMREMFTFQLALAEELGLPVIVHDRDSHADCLELTARFPAVKGVFHCFSGSAEMAQVLIERGWYLGFDGPVTYKNARKAIEVLEVCPMERILIETDSPYLTPVPHRGERNDSSLLHFTAEKIAEIKGVTTEEIARATLENGKLLFGLD